MLPADPERRNQRPTVNPIMNAADALRRTLLDAEMYRCHDMEHEDNSMMRHYRVDT